MDLSTGSIPFAVDRNPMKIGREMSGVKIPIISEKHAREKNPGYMLALPYYFEEEFVQRELDYLKGGGQFIFFLPKIKIVYWTDDGLKERVVWSPENK